MILPLLRVSLAPKRWPPKVLVSAGYCRRLLRIARLIPNIITDKIIVIAALTQVTTAERFKLDLGYF
jgi:hypothetical protein